MSVQYLTSDRARAMASEIVKIILQWQFLALKGKVEVVSLKKKTVTIQCVGYLQG